MREYKFRGIGLDGKWYFGDLRHNGSSLRIEWETTDWKAMPPLGKIVQQGKNVKKETVGQLIGRKDINGIDLYEGDIFENISSGSIFQIYFCNQSLTYRVIRKKDGWHFDFNEIGLTEGIEIIGNVHEKAELLQP